VTTPTGPGITSPQAPSFVGAASTFANGGQNLTPYQNVFALVQMGGDTWGANGGGAMPVAGPLPVLANAARGVRQVNAVYDAKNNSAVQAGLSNGSVSTQVADQTYADDNTKQVWTADLESPSVAASQL
jgi:hypothetical protein